MCRFDVCVYVLVRVRARYLRRAVNMHDARMGLERVDDWACQAQVAVWSGARPNVKWCESSGCYVFVFLFFLNCEFCTVSPLVCPIVLVIWTIMRTKQKEKSENIFSECRRKWVCLAKTQKHARIRTNTHNFNCAISHPCSRFGTTTRCLSAFENLNCNLKRFD